MRFIDDQKYTKNVSKNKKCSSISVTIYSLSKLGVSGSFIPPKIKSNRLNLNLKISQILAKSIQNRSANENDILKGSNAGLEII